MYKIAIISSLYKPTHPDVIGGQEVWTSNFALELSKGKYNIDLFALPKSISSKKIKLNVISKLSLELFREEDLNFQKNIIAIGIALYAKIIPKLMTENCDIIIDSSGQIIFPLSAKRINKPIIVIGHFPMNNLYVTIFKHFSQGNNVYFVLPSHYQDKNSPWLKNKIVIPHGIEIKYFNFQNHNKKESSFWVGRVTNNDTKGLIESVKLFNKIKKPLVAYTSFDEIEFFNKRIKPLLKKNIRIIKHFNRNSYNKFKIPGIHKLLIYPLKWEEPFGLVMIEAMACGTPVVALARGAIPEIIKDGQTGFIVNPSKDDIRGNWIIKKTGLAGLCEAVERIYAMPKDEYQVMRLACRAWVEEKFTLEKMVGRYEKLFHKIAKKSNN